MSKYVEKGKFNSKRWIADNTTPLKEADYGPDNPEFENYHEEFTDNVIDLHKFEIMEAAMKMDDPDLYAKCKGQLGQIWKIVRHVSKAEKNYRR